MAEELNLGAHLRGNEVCLTWLRGVEGGGSWWAGIPTGNTDDLPSFLLPDQATPQLQEVFLPVPRLLSHKAGSHPEQTGGLLH